MCLPGPSKHVWYLLQALATSNSKNDFQFDGAQSWRTVIVRCPTFATALSDDDTIFACMLFSYLLATGRDLNTIHGEDMSLLKERLAWFHSFGEVSGNGIELSVYLKNYYVLNFLFSPVNILLELYEDILARRSRTNGDPHTDFRRESFREEFKLIRFHYR